MNKLSLMALVAFLSVSCASSTQTPRHARPTAPVIHQPEFITSIVGINVLLLTPKIRMYEGRRPFDITLMTAWSSREASRRDLPRGVGLIFAPQREIPNTVLIVNFSNSHWVRTETMVDPATKEHVAIIPLFYFEKIIETGNLAGFLGDRNTFIEFALRTRDMDMFRRFVKEIYRRTGHRQVIVPARDPREVRRHFDSPSIE